MPFVKIIKTKAYFKRYQTKFRRRREGKTDYYARKRLVMQDKNKYAARKYRFVVRLHARQVCCQIVYSTIDHDEILCSAYSNELQKRYGLKVGLKNYAAAYATGLLLARRVLKKLGLDETYPGVEEVDGEVNKSVGEDGNEYYVNQVDEERRPFKCFLDVGTRPTTTGHRVFAAMKGASDGGLNIPHNEKRFPGYDRDEGEYSADVLRERIFGVHVANWMKETQEEGDAALYTKRFGGYQAAGVGPDDVEGMYAAVHAAIRANPEAAPKSAPAIDKKFKKRDARLTLAQRKERVAQKKAWRREFLAAQLAGDDSDSDEDDEDDSEDED